MDSEDACGIDDTRADSVALVLACARDDGEGMRAVLEHGHTACIALYLAHRVSTLAGVGEAEQEGCLEALIEHLVPGWRERARP